MRIKHVGENNKETRYVEEPDYSARQLQKFEKKYGISTDVFLYLYKLRAISLPEEDVRDWLWNYEINLRARILLQTGLDVMVEVP